MDVLGRDDRESDYPIKGIFGYVVGRALDSVGQTDKADKGFMRHGPVNNPREKSENERSSVDCVNVTTSRGPSIHRTVIARHEFIHTACMIL